MTFDYDEALLKEYLDLFHNQFQKFFNEMDVPARVMSNDLMMNEGYITKLLQRTSFPQYRIFALMCIYFGVHPRQFFDEEIELPAQYNEMLEYMKQMSGDQILHLLAIARDMIKR